MESTSGQPTFRRAGEGWTLHPVVLPVPAASRPLPGAGQLASQRALARVALDRSATYSGVRLETRESDNRGAPIPCHGVYWSISHTDDYVAAVVAPRPVGIDIEPLRPYLSSLPKQIAAADEWALLPTPLTVTLFYRYWTAKEAVLKAVGTGLAGLPDCSVEAVLDDSGMSLRYRSKQFIVRHHPVGPDHVCAVTAVTCPISWHEEVEAGN